MELRILIVDDSERVRGSIRCMLESRHWTVCGEAGNGMEGLQKFQAVNPDLVVIDLAMPDLNGFEVAKRMSTLNSKVPLILFTVIDITGLATHAKSVGISAVVSKLQAWDLLRVIADTTKEMKSDAPVQ